MKLFDLFKATGTDKGCYAPAYEMLLGERRYSIERVLEIGIGSLRPEATSSMLGWAAKHYHPGGSLRAWRDYFPNAEIVGLDVEDDTQFTEPRIRTFICDSTDREASTALLAHLGTFDIIIDDGSHASRDQLASLENFFGALRPGGLYFIEDVFKGTRLHKRPRLVNSFVGAAHWIAITEDDRCADAKKMIAIQADSALREATSCGG